MEHSSSNISRRVRQIVQMEPDTKHLAEALSHVSALPTHVNLKAHLRQNTLKTCKNFLALANPYIDEINGIVNTTEHVLSRCTEMGTQLQAILDCSSEAVRSGKKLQSDMEGLELKQAVADHVIQKFSLSDEDKDRLLHAEIDTDYFQSLQRLVELSEIKERLSENKVLKLGLEDYISQIYETVYERLFRFVQFQCKILSEDKIEIIPGFYQALAQIRSRPVYFNHCRQEIIKIRQEALCAQVPDIQHPELITSIGEYLAWTRSILISEMSLIESLLGSNEVLPQTAVDEDVETLQERTVLDEISEALVSVLRTKFEVYLGRTQAQDLSKLYNMYEFYINALTTDLLSFSNKLIELLYKSKLQTDTAFKSLLKSSNEQIRYLKTVQSKPPGMFLDRIALCVDVFTDTPKDTDIGELYELLIASVLRDYRTQAENYEDRHVLMINILHCIRFAIQVFEFAAEQTNELDVEIEEHIQTLVDQIEAHIVEENELNEESKESVYAFYQHLHTTGTLELPQLAHLLDPVIKEKIRMKIAQKILALVAKIAPDIEESILEKIEALLK